MTLSAAQALLSAGALQEAVHGFSACLESEPANAAAYQGRALAHFQLQRWSAAIADFTRAKELQPADNENWVGLGMSLAMESRIYEAIDVFEALLAAQPDYVRGRIQLGLLYYQLAAISRGRQQMERALAARPSVAERRLIERTLREQKHLDRTRYYRPDFEALNAHAAPSPLQRWMHRLRERCMPKCASVR